MYPTSTTDLSLIPQSAAGVVLPTGSLPQEWTESSPAGQSRRAAKSGRTSARNAAGNSAIESNTSTAEDEFMEAMQAYKEWSGRMFPTWSEVLEVLKSLGYQKSA